MVVGICYWLAAVGLLGGADAGTAVGSLFGGKGRGFAGLEGGLRIYLSIPWPCTAWLSRVFLD